MKICTQCDEEKPDDQFYCHRRVCKPCIIEEQRSRRAGVIAGDIQPLINGWGRSNGQTKIRAAN